MLGTAVDRGQADFQQLLAGNQGATPVQRRWRGAMLPRRDRLAMDEAVGRRYTPAGGGAAGGERQDLAPVRRVLASELLDQVVEVG